ncbi:MAG: hypothetical protein ACLUD7_04020 [Lachnospiraceae bacterium]
MKNINLKEFLLGLNFFDNKFLCEEEKKFLKYINIKNSKDALMYLEVICKDYCNKNKTSKNYASYLMETIKRAYITEFLNINKYDEIILENMNKYSDKKLESIVLAIDAINSFKDVGILILPNEFEFNDDEIIDSIELRLSK